MDSMSKSITHIFSSYSSNFHTRYFESFVPLDICLFLIRAQHPRKSVAMKQVDLNAISISAFIRLFFSNINILINSLQEHPLAMQRLSKRRPAIGLRLGLHAFTLGRSSYRGSAWSGWTGVTGCIEDLLSGGQLCGTSGPRGGLC